MSRRPPAFALVRIAALDVRRRPAHAAEMGSQLLLGEVVRIRGAGPAGRWIEIENASDGYRGWVRAWGLEPATRGAALAWRRRATARPARLLLEARRSPGRGPLVAPLYWGSRVIAGRRSGRWREVLLPGGIRAWVEARGLATGRRTPETLAGRARELLGIPYLWGGKTPGGMDCSGLVQMLLAERGLRLPRDAADQERSTRRLAAREHPRPGDLAFFGAGRGPAGHVGALLPGGYYLHARGQVRLNHMDPSNPLWDKELASQFRGIRRPRRRPVRAI